MNKLLISAAGSGKTTYLVREAFKIKDDRVLITTFTNANENEIINKFYEIEGYIPENIKVQSWFSFLLQHGVKPYQSFIFTEDINGLVLVNEKSGFRYMAKNNPVYFSEKETKQFYFDKNMNIYSDKLSFFVFNLNRLSKGLVVDRISRIYPYIFIDEIQDLAGYDLELIKLFLKSEIIMLMVGDPRQVTYHTHYSLKNKKYRGGLIEQYLEDHCKSIEIDVDKTSLNHSYRNCHDICVYANNLYPDYLPCTASQKEQTGHDGVFFVRQEDVDEYLRKFCPVQLRYSVGKKVNTSYEVYNFGESKGLSFKRVLIYPTQPMLNWIKDNSSDLKDESRSKLYVGITRAEYSVGIVYDFSEDEIIDGIQNYHPD